MLTKMLAVMFLLMTSHVSADDFSYSGQVTGGTGGLGTLIPIGSDLGGTISITPTPGGTTTDVNDVTSALLIISNAAGSPLFCFFLNETCTGGTAVPVTAITAIDLTFSAAGCPVSGTIDILTFSPTFMIDIPVLLDISNGTFFAESAGLGDTSGTGAFDCASAVDTDSDGVQDSLDNCTLIANADQRDTNGDGYGNVCDPDTNNNGTVEFGDVSAWVPLFNTPCGVNSDNDFNGDGFCNFGDYALFPEFFQQPPGPSGIAP